MMTIGLELLLLFHLLLMLLQIVVLQLTAANSNIKAGNWLLYAIWFPVILVITLILYRVSTDTFEYYESLNLCICIASIAVMLMAVLFRVAIEKINATSCFIAYMLGMMFYMATVTEINVAIRMIYFFAIARLLFSLHRITQDSPLDVAQGIVFFLISLAISIVMHPWFDKCVFTGVFHLR